MKITFMKTACAAAGLMLLLAGCGNTEAPTEPATLPPEPTAGWVTEGDTRHYENADGTALTGWLKENGSTYYLLEGGIPATGWQVIGDETYYFGAAGHMVTGWLNLSDALYCLDEEGRLCSGLRQVDGEAYLFNPDGTLACGWVDDRGVRYYADDAGHPVTGWLELEGATYYLDENGIMATGALDIDGKTCYFDSTGAQFLLVNPWNYLPEDYEVELVSIGMDQCIAAEAYDDFQAMMADCTAAGYQPVVCSSYRTELAQDYLYQRRIRRYMNENGYTLEQATEAAGRSVAVPGTSEHQLGLALDIIDNRNWSLDESQASMPTQQWLLEHCWDYGFILRYPSDKSEITGIIYEPWHYRYVGKALALELRDSGLCLEEYFASLSVG